MSSKISRAYGCMLGQICGDALGAQVEFKPVSNIKALWPKGVREMKNGGTFNLIAGQVTDDTEMAFSLAYSLVVCKKFEPESVKEYYKKWINSQPFDCGITISSALRGTFNPSSEANGALMRISPLAIFAAGNSNISDNELFKYACIDAKLTHINPVCSEINGIYALAIKYAINTDGITGKALYDKIIEYSENKSYNISEDTKELISISKKELPKSYSGWVKNAFQIALYYLYNGGKIEDILSDTIMAGGDTDTNAAIVGALIGAVYGYEAFPQSWVDIVSNCKPKAGDKGVANPRPECYWPSQWKSLTDRLFEPSKN